MFATDGSFDSSKYNVSGDYVSFFAPDVTTIAADKAVVAGYHKQFPGGHEPVRRTELRCVAAVRAGGPAGVHGRQGHDHAAPRCACALAKQKIAKSILGIPMAFTPNGDVSGAKVFVFKIVNGKYVTVALALDPWGHGSGRAPTLFAPELNLFITELVAGIVHGSVYALIALGYSMVYGILKLLNFAHGDVYMVGSFIGYGILTVFGGATSLSIPIGLLIVLMFLAATLGGGLLGVVIERFAYRRLREAPRIAPLITALGVSFFLENAAVLLLERELRELQHLQLGHELLRPRRPLAERLHAPGRASTSRSRRSSSSPGRSS